MFLKSYIDLYLVSTQFSHAMREQNLDKSHMSQKQEQAYFPVTNFYDFSRAVYSSHKQCITFNQWLKLVKSALNLIVIGLLTLIVSA